MGIFVIGFPSTAIVILSHYNRLIEYFPVLIKGKEDKEGRQARELRSMRIKRSEDLPKVPGYKPSIFVILSSKSEGTECTVDGEIELGN